MFRILTDGTIECQTIEEALQLRASILAKPAPAQRDGEAGEALAEAAPADPPPPSPSIDSLLRKLCEEIPDNRPASASGRPPLPIRVAIFSIILKAHLNLSARDIAARVENAPHFNSIMRYMENNQTTAILTDLLERSGARLPEAEEAISVSTKTKLPTTQANEALARRIGHNLERILELGLEPDFTLPKSPPAEQETAAPAVPVLDRAASRRRGQEVKALRVAAGWSQKTLGEKIGMQQSDVSLIELGNKLCSEELLAQVRGLLEGLPQRKAHTPIVVPKQPLRRAAASGSTFEEMLASDPTLKARVQTCKPIDDSEPQRIAVPIALARS